MKWIDINEQMPERDTPVLIASYEYCSWMICVAEWRYGNVKYPVSWRCIGCEGYEWDNDFTKIDYWQPLPEPPQRKQE